jgi:hypothetical protein
MDALYNKILSEDYGINCKDCESTKDSENSVWLDILNSQLNLNKQCLIKLQILFQ